MKKQVIKLAILLISFQGMAQNVELSNAFLKEYEVKQSQVTTKSANAASSQDYLWKTPFLHKVLTNWDVLTQEAKDVFEVYTQAPTFSGDEEIYQEGKFKFHYTTNSGKDGEDVDVTDENNSGTPDYIESMATDFVKVSAKYHTELGLTEVVYDDDDFYHVYVHGDDAGNGVYGYVSADPSDIVGDNPASTDAVEMDAAKSYMVMRNHYRDFDEPEKALKVTAAHEYMHAIQYSYDWEVEYWFAEAAAVWGEEYVYPGYDDNFQYMSYVFSSPDVALNFDDYDDSFGFEEFEGHWYGTFLFVQYMVEHTGEDIMHQIYQDLIGNWQDESITSDAIEDVLKANWSDDFSGFDELFESYAIANTALSSEEKYAPYTYSRGEDYYAEVERDFYNEDVFSFDGDEITFESESDGNDRLMRLSYDPFSMLSNQNFKLTLTVGGSAKMALMKVSDTETEVVFADENDEINVTDNDKWKGYYITVIRLDTDVADTRSLDYVIKVNQESTGIDKVEEMSFALVPNPANGFVKLEGCDNLENVQIFDVAGRLVASYSNCLLEPIDVSALAVGTYVVKAKASNQDYMVEQLVITNK